MKLIGVVFTRLGGISRLAFVYRCQDGSIKTIPAAICRKGENNAKQKGEKNETHKKINLCTH